MADGSLNTDGVFYIESGTNKLKIKTDKPYAKRDNSLRLQVTTAMGVKQSILVNVWVCGQEKLTSIHSSIPNVHYDKGYTDWNSGVNRAALYKHGHYLI